MWKQWAQQRFQHLLEDGLDGCDIHVLVRNLNSKIRSRRRKSVTLLAAVSEDPANRLIILQDGAVRPLIRLLHRDEGEHRACVLAILGSLSSSHTIIRKELLSAGVTTSLVPLLSVDIPDVKCGAACVLYCLSNEIEGQKQIADSGACHELPRLLFRGETSYEEWVIRLMGNLIQGSPQLLHPVTQAGGVKRLVGAAINGTETVRLHSIRVLAVILEENSEESASVLSAGGIPLFIESLTPVSGNREMGEWAIRGLARLTSHSESRAEVIASNGVSAVVQMLWEKDDTVKENAARAIANIAESRAPGISSILSGSVEALSSMLASESDLSKEWGARAVGNLAQLNVSHQLAFVEYGAVHKTIWGLESRSQHVQLEMVKALEHLTKNYSASQEIARNSGGVHALCTMLFDDSTSTDAAEAALGILLALCWKSSESQMKLSKCYSGIEGLVSLLSKNISSRGYSLLFKRALQLLKTIMTAPEGLDILLSRLSTWQGWRLLSEILEKDDMACKSAAMSIISAIIANTMGEVHAKLHATDITNIVDNLRLQSKKCEDKALEVISLLCKSSPVYSAQIVSSGALPDLVRYVCSNKRTLAEQAIQALKHVAAGGQENKTLIARAGAVSAIVLCLGETNQNNLDEVANTLYVIVEDHPSNCQLLAHEGVLEMLISKLEVASGVTARYLASILMMLSQTLTPKELEIMEETAMQNVLKALSDMVTCGDPTWQKNALCRIVEVVGSPLASQESTLGAISGLVVVLAQSEDKKICNHAKTVLSQMASQVKFLAPSVRSGGVPVLVPFLNGSSPSICAHTLDEMLNEPSQEGSREKAFMNAGGIRPLISVLTFGTSTCKGKAAELILDMAEHSSEFCEVAIRDGVIKPLVGLLAVEDTQCREATRKALTYLTGKDIITLTQAERIQVITEVLSSKGGDTEGVTSLMRNMDAFSVASGDSTGSQELKLDAGHAGSSEGGAYTLGSTSRRPLLAEPISECLLCPITQEPMADPVIAADGHTYERSAIEAWFKSHSSSPMTNRTLPNLTLIPNHVVEQLVAEHHNHE